MKIKTLTKADIEITLAALEEDIPVRGNALYGAGKKETKRYEDKIIKALESGNQWAWCTVAITCNYMQLEHAVYLGACSYESEHDFIENSGHYESMVQECIDELQKQLNDLIACSATCE